MFKNKNVFVTGTNKGIGKEILTQFAIKGANVFAHARKETPDFLLFIEELRKEHQANITPVFFDMTDSVKMKEEIQKLYKNKNYIDILVNNAGVAHGAFFQMTSVSQIKEVFDINFFSHMELTQLILKRMTQRENASIVNISSISGIDLKEGNCAYGTSKAAMIAWTKVLSKELARYKIRVNAIAPGLTDTQMATMMENKAGAEMTNSSLMKRLGTPKEIAEVVLFLSSDNSSFINGQIIRADGGEM